MTIMDESLYYKGTNILMAKFFFVLHFGVKTGLKYLTSGISKYPDATHTAERSVLDEYVNMCFTVLNMEKKKKKSQVSVSLSISVATTFSTIKRFSSVFMFLLEDV